MGDKLDIDTYRGIFIVNTFKSILMKMIYQDKSKVFDSTTSDFQIGGRKGKNVRDHIFVVNGIVQNTLSSVKNKPINMVVADFKLCLMVCPCLSHSRIFMKQDAKTTNWP